MQSPAGTFRPIETVPLGPIMQLGFQLQLKLSDMVYAQG